MDFHPYATYYKPSITFNIHLRDKLSLTDNPILETKRIYTDIFIPHATNKGVIRNKIPITKHKQFIHSTNSRFYWTNSNSFTQL